MPLLATPIQAQAGSNGLVDFVARTFKSFAKQPDKHPSGSWTEISPYGFMSRNYISYVSGQLNNCSISRLDDGSLIVNFADGSMLVQSVSGHAVELDRNRRVVLVRVTRAEAEGAALTMGKRELSKCFKAGTNEAGHTVVVMPGNIVIVEQQDQVTVRFPNGTEFFARKTYSADLVLA